MLARRIGYPFKLPHAKPGEVSEGMRGDYVIQPENGGVEDQYIVFAETFLERYIAHLRLHQPAESYLLWL